MLLTAVVAQSTANQDTVRIAGLIMTVLSVALLVLALRVARRPSRLRMRRDLIRLVLQSGGAAWIATASGVGVSVPLVVSAGLAGAVAGWYQGKTVDISQRGERIYIRRSLLGVFVWASGLMLMQLAAIANQSGLVEIGHAMSWFSAGVTAGMLFGRAEPVAIARRGFASAAALSIVAAIFFSVSVPLPASADHLGPLALLDVQIDCGAVLDSLNVSNERLTYDASDDDPRLFITCLPGGKEPIVQVFEFADVDAATALVAGLRSGHGDIQHQPPDVGGEQEAFYEFTGGAAGCQLLARIGRRVYGFVANDTSCEGRFLDDVSAILMRVPKPSADDLAEETGAAAEVTTREDDEARDEAEIEAAEDFPATEDEDQDSAAQAGADQDSADQASADEDSQTTPVEVINDPEDVTVDEATATALTALVVILANGAISLIEFAELERLSRRSPGSFRRAVATLVVHGPADADPPKDPVESLLDTLSEIDEIKAPGAVAMPPVVPRSEHDPWYYPPPDPFAGVPEPVPGSLVYDVDRDGEVDVVAVDDDADGLTDRLVTPGDPPAFEPDTEDPGDVSAAPADQSSSPDDGAGPDPTTELGGDIVDITPPAAAAPAAVAITQQEIDDIIAWGTRHGRSPEDIQKDVDGLNVARGGTGSIRIGDLPEPVERVETPSGWVSATASEASGYVYAKELVQYTETMKAATRAISRRLQDEIDYWNVFERQPEIRWAAGLLEVMEVNDEWGAAQEAINTEIWQLHRQPGRADWDVERFDSYDEAWNAYEQRNVAIDRLVRQRSEVDAKYSARLARMTLTTEVAGGQYSLDEPRLDDSKVEPYDDLAGGSMFNRPSERLAQLAIKQDEQLAQYAQLDETADRSRAIVEAFEARSEKP